MKKSLLLLAAIISLFYSCGNETTGTKNRSTGSFSSQSQQDTIPPRDSLSSDTGNTSALFAPVAVDLSGNAPNPLIDSLKQALANTRQDTEIVKILLKIAAEFGPSDPDSSMHFARSAYQKAHQTDLLTLKLKTSISYCRALANAGKHKESAETGLKDIPLADKALKKNKDPEFRKLISKRKADLLRTIGAAYDLASKYPEAQHYYFESLKISEELGDTASQALSLHNIGGVYMSLDRDDEALTYFKKAYTLNNLLQNHAMLAMNISNIAVVYSKKKQVAQAIESYKEALTLFQNVGDKDNAITTLLNLGLLNIENEHYAEGKNYLEKILESKEYIESVKNISTVYQGLGLIQWKYKNYRMARILQDSALYYATQNGDLDNMEVIHYALYQLDSLEGKCMEAMAHLKASYEAKDGIHSEENASMLTEVRLGYEFSRKEAEAKAEQEKKDIRQRDIRNSIIAALIGSIFFLGIVYRQRNKIAKARKRSDELLLNILPEEVAEELKVKGEAEARQLDDVTVLFTDFKGFTQLSEQLSARELVQQIHICFSAFDKIMEKHGLEKIKTIGDAYMAAGGMPVPNLTHARDAVMAAMDIIQFIEEQKARQIADGKPYFEIRIGVHTGPVVAGIVGIKKFAYDIWGDTVNTASRMESSGEPGHINISGSTYALVKHQFACTYRGKIQAKNKGELDMYFVDKAV